MKFNLVVLSIASAVAVQGLSIRSILGAPHMEIAKRDVELETRDVDIDTRDLEIEDRNVDIDERDWKIEDRDVEIEDRDVEDEIEQREVELEEREVELDIEARDIEDTSELGKRRGGFGHRGGQKGKKKWCVGYDGQGSGCP